MKKLNKILAAISTAVLTFCVWDTQTQAKVVTNENDIPTHIEADTNDEFFEDLKQVLKHIGSRLVVDGYEPQRIHELFLKKNELTKETENSIPCSEYTQKQYNCALEQQQIHIEIAIGYLYRLLLNSNINNDQPAVYNLRVKVDGYTGIGDDIVFQLPCHKNYYICNLRWWKWPKDLFENKRTPVPMTVEEAFREAPEFQEEDLSATLWIINPKFSGHQFVRIKTATKLDLTERGSDIIKRLIYWTK